MSHGHTCPHCGSAMDPIRTPLESSWGGELHHICFNDDCSYFTNSWNALEDQGIEKTGYRCRMDPRGGCGPAPVWSGDALKDLVVKEDSDEISSLSWLSAIDLGRDDETPDGDFYTRPRFVDHLDSYALETVEQLYARLIPTGSSILDLMAGPDSHLDKVSDTSIVVGLGLNKTELEANPILSEHTIHDLNSDPRLPLPDNRFDVVINTVSVDYLTRPLEVFREVSRVLKPDGLFIECLEKKYCKAKGGAGSQVLHAIGQVAHPGVSRKHGKTTSQGRQVLWTRHPERSDLRSLGQTHYHFSERDVNLFRLQAKLTHDPSEF
jgi:SAM-dependent methyltransferase